ncbi:7785_t:CDS:1, partial [Dentiscutata heterogama]
VEWLKLNVEEKNRTTVHVVITVHGCIYVTNKMGLQEKLVRSRVPVKCRSAKAATRLARHYDFNWGVGLGLPGVKSVSSSHFVFV